METVIVMVQIRMLGEIGTFTHRFAEWCLFLHNTWSSIFLGGTDRNRRPSQSILREDIPRR
jgi:hypothetical protein